MFSEGAVVAQSIPENKSITGLSAPEPSSSSSIKSSRSLNDSVANELLFIRRIRIEEILAKAEELFSINDTTHEYARILCPPLARLS